eukprot:16435060-Heterocapsa_arctica.AAC.1
MEALHSSLLLLGALLQGNGRNANVLLLDHGDGHLDNHLSLLMNNAILLHEGGHTHGLLLDHGDGYLDNHLGVLLKMRFCCRM